MPTGLFVPPCGGGPGEPAGRARALARLCRNGRRPRASTGVRELWKPAPHAAQVFLLVRCGGSRKPGERGPQVFSSSGAAGPGKSAARVPQVSSAWRLLSCLVETRYGCAPRFYVRPSFGPRRPAISRLFFLRITDISLWLGGEGGAKIDLSAVKPHTNTNRRGRGFIDADAGGRQASGRDSY
jgi:hypothetical protein